MRDVRACVAALPLKTLSRVWARKVPSSARPWSVVTKQKGSLKGSDEHGARRVLQNLRNHSATAVRTGFMLP